jgi:ammonium transporter, Amt family
MPFALDTGNTAWMIAATALVLLMTPALAFFYGGMVRSKSVLNMMMMSFVSLGTVAVIWVVYGYGLTFGPGASSSSIVGDPSGLFGLNGVPNENSLAASVGVPFLIMAAFQATFAIITVALISGSIADRTKFASWTLFTIVWITLVYAPIAHAVWGGGLLGPSGWIAEHISVPIDFAGGTVVHINAGAAALALAIVLGKRKGFGKEAMRPHNLPFVMLGAALLWFGWFGFNAGSEFGADATAGRAFLNTMVAPAFALLGWILVEKLRDGRPTSLGAASGIVAGLVAITPAAASVDTWGALAIGLIAGMVCALAVGLKYKLGLDDSLDVVGVHFVGGWVGTLLIGFFANLDEGTTWAPNLGVEGVPQPHNGVFYGGGWAQLEAQGIAALAATVISFALTIGIALAIKRLVGFRVTETVEVNGIDLAEHGETAYEEAK